MATTWTCCGLKAKEMEAAIADVPGLEELQVEQQTNIPQLRIELDRDALVQYGLRPADVMELVETAMNGQVVSHVLLGQRTFDLVVRLDEHFREDESKLRRMAINLPDGGVVPLEQCRQHLREHGAQHHQSRTSSTSDRVASECQWPRTRGCRQRCPRTAGKDRVAFGLLRRVRRSVRE